MVRAFTHGAMGRRIDSSWWANLAISHSSQCSMTGVTKAVVCAILSSEIVRAVVAAGFLSSYMNGHLPYIRRHIILLKCVECIVK